MKKHMNNAMIQKDVPGTFGPGGNEERKGAEKCLDIQNLQT